MGKQISTKQIVIYYSFLLRFQVITSIKYHKFVPCDSFLNHSKSRFLFFKKTCFCCPYENHFAHLYLPFVFHSKASVSI